MPKNLSFIFDIDDTAYDQLAPFRLALEKNFPRLVETLAVEQLYKQTRYFSDLAFEKTERGDMDIWDMRIYRITSAFERLGVKIAKKQGLAFEKDYANFLQHIQLNPTVEKTLKLCKEQGCKLGVITNGPVERQKAKIRQLCIARWIPKENWFISGQVKLMKPDPKIFNYAQVKMKLFPETTYYIGDSYANDVVGGKKAGWRVIWLNHRKHAEPSAADIQADYTLTDPDELLGCIKEIIREYL